MTTATSTVRKSADREGFRQAMSWLHTWAGLILGWLLFAIFLTGTLSFFRSEFNLWMRPEMHGLPRTDAADAQVAQKSVDALVRKAPDVTQWILHLPDDRDPAVNMLWRGTGNGRFETLRMNPQTGEPIEAGEVLVDGSVRRPRDKVNGGERVEVAGTVIEESTEEIDYVIDARLQPGLFAERSRARAGFGAAVASADLEAAAEQADRLLAELPPTEKKVKSAPNTRAA